MTIPSDSNPPQPPSDDTPPARPSQPPPDGQPASPPPPPPPYQQPRRPPPRPNPAQSGGITAGTILVIVAAVAVVFLAVMAVIGGIAYIIYDAQVGKSPSIVQPPAVNPYVDATPEDLRQAVYDAVLAASYNDQGNALEQLGELPPEDVLPHVIALLQDPSTHEKLRSQAPEGKGRPYRIFGAMYLLERPLPTEAIAPLGDVTAGGPPYMRRIVYWHIVNSSDPAALPYVLQALQDPSPVVRRVTLERLETLIIEDRMPQEIRAAVEPLLPGLMRDGETAYRAGWYAYRQDPAGFLAVSRDPDTLRADNPELVARLNVLLRRDLLVPRESALALVAAYEAGQEFAAGDAAVGMLYCHIGAHKLSEDRPRLRAWVDQENELLSQNAAHAYLRNLEQLTQWDLPIRQVREGVRDASDLSPGHRDAMLIGDAVEILDSKGFDDYFWSEDAARWRELVTALRNVGANDMADTIEQAAAKFGPDGPALDLETRQDQIVTLMETTDFHPELSSYVNQPEAELFVWRHLVRHPDYYDRTETLDIPPRLLRRLMRQEILTAPIVDEYTPDLNLIRSQRFIVLQPHIVAILQDPEAHDQLFEYAELKNGTWSRLDELMSLSLYPFPVEGDAVLIAMAPRAPAPVQRTILRHLVTSKNIDAFTVIEPVLQGDDVDLKQLVYRQIAEDYENLLGPDEDLLLARQFQPYAAQDLVDPAVSEAAARALWAMQGDDFLASLNTPAHLQADSPTLSTALTLLYESSVETDRDLLLTLLDDLLATDADSDRYAQANQVIWLLGAHENAADDALFLRLLEHPAPPVFGAAARQLIVRRGQSGWYRPYDLEASDELAATAPDVPEAHAMRRALRFHFLYIRSDAFTDYYYDEEANHMAATIQALKDIGAAEHAEMLMRSATAFHDATPSLEPSRRADQLEAGAAENLASYDQAYAELPELYHYLNRHAARHPDIFQSPPSQDATETD